MPATNIHTTYLKIAKVYAEMSYAKRRKVGAIIVKDQRIISTGYNGMVAGMSNDCEILEIKKIPVSVGMSRKEEVLVTKKEVIHAEANAILFAAKNGIPTDGATLYITVSPCIECAKMIVQSGIKEVYFLEEYKDTSGLDLLNKAGIVFHLGVNTNTL